MAFAYEGTVDSREFYSGDRRQRDRRGRRSQCEDERSESLEMSYLLSDLM
jgi:hypothetical protein